MSQVHAERKTLEVLAEEFVSRYRRGERPTLTEYLDAHPELASEIRDLFPTLVMMEELAPSDSGSVAAPTLAPSEQPRLAIGDYRILREIGRGGMGIVYEAEQLSLGRRIALKVLARHGTADSTVRQRFHREARAAAQLHHTNIVPVFEVGEDQEACWYAMQLILGQGLDQIIEELRQHQKSRSGERPAVPRTNVPPLSQVTQALVKGQFACPDLDASTPPPASQASPLASSDSSLPTSRSELSVMDSVGDQYYRSVARIGRQAAEALAYAHARGIIHRDVKPSNLLLDTAGVLWITDFGLAKTQENSLTTTGDIVGTLRYMAPERFKGEGDERADVYSLGLTLYELLVLRPAFAQRDRLQLIDQIKSQEPARPRTLDPRIPRDLETIVLKAIDKEAKRRYPSVEALADDLRHFLADEPITARRTSQLERLRLWSRRNPALAALLLVLMLVAASATATAFYLKATLDDSEANRGRAEKAELEGEHKLWLSYLSQAQARRMSRQHGQRFASLLAIKEALALPMPPGHSRDELRAEAIAALCLPDLELAREGGREIIGAEGFAIDPAFQRYAVADKDGNVFLRRLSDDVELLRLPGAGLVGAYRGLQFSPDGRFLYQQCHVRSGWRSRLWDLNGPEPKAVLDDGHINLTFRPDSRQCAACYPDKTVRLFDTSSGRELLRFSVASVPSNGDLNWNPKFPQLVFSVGTSLRLLNVDTGAVTSLGLKLPRKMAWMDWHPEGRLLAVADTNMTIHLWDVAADRPALPPLVGHKANGIVMKFNHAGDRLLSTDWAGSWHLWDTRSGQLLLSVPAPGSFLYFSPDDRLVGSGGEGKIQLYRLSRGEELRTVVHRSPVGRRGYAMESGPRVDPEGRLFALITHYLVEGIPLVDVARGEEVALLPLPGNSPMCFDRDGALWTYGSVGVLRWPLTANPKTGQRRYGPPQRIASLAGGSVSADLRTLAIPDNSRGTLVWDRDGGRRLRLGPQEDVRYTAVSPDGRWVATGSHWLHEGAGVKVWDARDGKHVKDFIGNGPVQFSPDGKWLLTRKDDDGCHLWAVGTWEEGPSLGRSPANPTGAFSADGRMLALGDALGVVRLVVTDSGAEIARLMVPAQTRLIPGSFTPDGRRLIVFGLDTGELYVLDLPAIRAGLAKLDLDWDAPPLPAASGSPDAASIAPGPLSIHFDLGDLQHWAEADALVMKAAQLILGKKESEGLAALRQAVQIAPSHATAHNNLAWLLLTGPKDLRDPAQALREARKSVEMAPDQFTYHNTLGVALYRTEHFAEAVPVLERSLREGKGQTDAFDLFFLAMCHHRLGDAAKAKDCYERATRWFRKHQAKIRMPGWVEELKAFQAESAAVLAQPPGKVLPTTRRRVGEK